MRLGIVSDTHGHMLNAQAAVRMLESLEVDEILHCGDIGSTEIPALFAPWPAHFVLGNCDPNGAELKLAVAAAGKQFHGRFGDLMLAGRRIALIHSDDARLFHQTVSSGFFDLVCYGHTHQMEQHFAGKTLVLNPGALYRANPHTIAVVDLETMEATIVPI
jgi:uncharacterized protein